MLAVISAEIVQVDETKLKVMHYCGGPYNGAGSKEQLLATDIRESIIKGRYYRRSDGEEIVVGVGVDVQNALGVAIESTEALQRENADLNKTICKVRETMRELKDENAAQQKYIDRTFWVQMKKLFVGWYQLL